MRNSHTVERAVLSGSRSYTKIPRRISVIDYDRNTVIGRAYVACGCLIYQPIDCGHETRKGEGSSRGRIGTLDLCTILIQEINFSVLQLLFNRIDDSVIVSVHPYQAGNGVRRRRRWVRCWCWTPSSPAATAASARRSTSAARRPASTSCVPTDHNGARTRKFDRVNRRCRKCGTPSATGTGIARRSRWSHSPSRRMRCDESSGARTDCTVAGRRG